jgi:hypothetical protein
MKTLGLVVMATAILIFYLIFFQLAPWIAGLIPAGDWTPFLRFLVYIAVAWIGGIALPIGILILGFIAFIKGL